MDKRFHVKFLDEDTGEELGLLLREPGGYERRLANPFAARMGEGPIEYRDLTDWAVFAQDDWRGGRGQDSYKKSETAFADAMGLETRLEGQLTLGPLPHVPLQDVPQHEPTTKFGRWFGCGSWELNTDEGTSGTGVDNEWKLAQLVNEKWHGLLGNQGEQYLRSVQLYLGRNPPLDSGNITVRIYSNGSDGLPDTELGNKALAYSNVGISYGWVRFDFASPIDLSNHEKWWISVEHDDPSDDAYIRWRNAPNENPYRRGYAAFYWAPRGGWNRTYDRLDRMFKVHWAQHRIAQSFTTGGSGFTLNRVWLYGMLGASAFKVALCSDNAGVPGTELTSVGLWGRGNVETIGTGSTTTTIELDSNSDTDGLLANMWVRINGEERQISAITDSDTFTLKTALSSAPSEGDQVYASIRSSIYDADWVEVEFFTGQALNANTKYWIAVEATRQAPALYNGHQQIYRDISGGYGGGDCKVYSGGSWGPVEGFDLAFRLNNYGLDGEVIALAMYNNKLYAAAGNAVYEWDESVEAWNSSKELTGDTVTDLEVWGGYLFAAWGNDNTTFYYNGSTWTDTTENFTYLRAAKGYLHCSGAGTNAHKVYYYSDPATLSKTLLAECGASSDYPITGLAWFQDYLVAATPIQLWSCYVEEKPFPILDWRDQEHDDNGKGMASWSRDASLYIPLRYGLYRFDGDVITSVGPEEDLGLPPERQGTINALLPTNNWLYVAVDAGDDGISSVLCYNGRGGWHEIARGERRGDRIRSLGYSTLQEPDRLWYGLGGATRYVILPDKGDNPYQWNLRRDNALNFTPTGTLVGSWIGSDLIEVPKDLHSVTIRGEGFSSTTTVRVLYQLDRLEYDGGEIWSELGTIEGGTRKELFFTAPDWGPKGIGSGSTVTTIELSSSYSTDGMQAGDCVRINEQVTQIKHITDSDTFELNMALKEAPSSGDVAYPSLPVAREFRVRLILSTKNKLETPKVLTYLVRYQPNVLDRYVFTLNVRCEHGMDNLAGSPYDLSPANLRTELSSWARRQTPFTLRDPDGEDYTVKVTQAAEGGVARKDSSGEQQYNSHWRFTLVEVD